MSNIVMKTAELMELLPEADQAFAYEFMKKLVLAWDPDYTKLTTEEAARLAEADESGFVDVVEIDWAHLEKYAD